MFPLSTPAPISLLANESRSSCGAIENPSYTSTRLPITRGGGGSASPGLKHSQVFSLQKVVWVSALRPTHSVISVRCRAITMIEVNYVNISGGPAQCVLSLQHQNRELHRACLFIPAIKKLIVVVLPWISIQTHASWFGSDIRNFFGASWMRHYWIFSKSAICCCSLGRIPAQTWSVWPIHHIPAVLFNRNIDYNLQPVHKGTGQGPTWWMGYI